MTPVLMHEPYQRAPERGHSPYEQSPSPVSPEGHGSRFANTASYSRSSASNTPGSYTNSAYSRSPTSLPSSMDIHTNPEFQIPQDNHSYHSPDISPSSWSRNGHYYHSPPQQYLQHHHTNTGYSSSVSATSNPPHPPHIYSTNISAPIPMQVYSPSYSLQAALTPPLQTQVEIVPFGPAHRGPQLSPLHIPMGAHGHNGESKVSPSIDIDHQATAPGQEEEDCALAPLSILRRSMTLRRDPSDEKTLRMLREKKSKS